ncbi:50S ribosomal protein L21 [Tranquillimonas alkanivorans]|uniref:Large ribosomal subunit protein bL21 n=1 Tax=Tranquillimonas alkanivorans TaxID=441119 RepID=A0A1I5RU78_9RHOB|nr:50S ribosomal protein L21 [Tranquillimonas alkanivorans]SFP62072.1 LSU ribosomal protein L21P [Tranquillimonas alkanivorans]
MFAVLKTGGKQYRVQSGDVLRVEKLAANAGEKVQFNEILMVGGTVGTPLVEGAGVQAEVLDQVKGDKVIHFVKRRRKHGSKRTKGHRQQLTLLRVTDILESGADSSGIKAAVGAGSVPGGFVASDDRYTQNRADQAEMKKRVKTGGAQEKSAETPAGASDDDLKKLTGVGPALEKKLHEAGITSFAQIASWSDEDVAEWDAKADLKGKIEKEGWVDQAKAILAEKE